MRRSAANDADTRLYLLVLRCQAGDESAFAQLVRFFGERTLAHLRTIVGSDADDVQQDVWLTVYRRLPALANPRAFRTWLFQTTRHRAIDYLRARKREQELFDGINDAETDSIAAPNDEAFDLAGGAIASAFEQLAPAHREVRTASLLEIQLRLAALEEMLTRDAAVPGEDGERRSPRGPR
jgi:RNA polymerase sigma-70 factor (ECF subfamily)